MGNYQLMQIGVLDGLGIRSEVNKLVVYSDEVIENVKISEVNQNDAELVHLDSVLPVRVFG